jgi:hypothetical protein
MNLEWRVVVRDDELWGWRLYKLLNIPAGTDYFQSWRVWASVRLLLCETKQPIKLWMYRTEVNGKHKKMFYTEEEAKAWALAIVRMT